MQKKKKKTWSLIPQITLKPSFSYDGSCNLSMAGISNRESELQEPLSDLTKLVTMRTERHLFSRFKCTVESLSILTGQCRQARVETLILVWSLYFSSACLWADQLLTSCPSKQEGPMQKNMAEDLGAPIFQYIYKSGSSPF